MWEYNETSEFVECAEQLELSEQIREALKSWARSVNRTPSKRCKIYFRSPNNIFEIWTARIPDPDSNRGSRSGFRLAYILNLTEDAIYVDKIEQRANLGSRRERPRDMRRFNQYLDSLKEHLLERFESE